jgi:hypothetical protein
VARSRPGPDVRPAHGVHPLRHHWRRRAAELARATSAAESDRGTMAKLRMPTATAAALSVRERVLLFCTASCADGQHAGVTGEAVTAMAVKGIIERDASGASHSRIRDAPCCGRCCRTYEVQRRTALRAQIARRVARPIARHHIRREMGSG